MKLLLPLILATLLSGCAATKHPVYTPPSSIALVKAVQGTKAKVAEVKKYVRPEGAAAVKELEQKVEETELSLSSYVLQVDKLTERLMTSENRVVELEAQHFKDLRIIWRWRLIALGVVVAVVSYIGIKTAWKFYL